MLTTWPIIDVAREHPDVACMLHKEMITGVVESLGALLAWITFRPFAAPEGCLINLSFAIESLRAPNATTQEH